MTAAGRDRWGEFPPVVADDQFVNQIFDRDEVAVVEDVTSTVTPPSSLRALASSEAAESSWQSRARRRRRRHRNVAAGMGRGPPDRALPHRGPPGVSRGDGCRSPLGVERRPHRSGIVGKRLDIATRAVRGRAGVTLRSVLFHHIADRDSTFTSGLGVTMGIDDFRARIADLARRYHPVSFEDVRAATEGAPLPPRALLVIFDDAYASVADTAAAVLDDHGIPSVFFVNGGFVDHEEMSIDNLVTHTANTAGAAALERAVAAIRPGATSTTRATILADLVPGASFGRGPRVE